MIGLAESVHEIRAKAANYGAEATPSEVIQDILDSANSDPIPEHRDYW